MEGQVIAFIGIALCVFLCGLGSAIGLSKTGSASSAVLAEDGKLFGKVIVLTLLPATQGLYGFVIGIIASGKATAINDVSQGWAIFGATLAIAVMGLFSAIYQGKTAVAGINAVAKNESISGKLMLFPAMIEFYAILALVISIMLLSSI